jgi:hypothetical protein
MATPRSPSNDPPASAHPGADLVNKPKIGVAANDPGE